MTKNASITKENLFKNLDFTTILDNPNFQEDSVREIIILPIFTALGYTQANIVRSKTLIHPYLKIGSKKRAITLFPDYALKVDSNFFWVLDAKAPNQKIINDDNVEQVYSYATHPEIRSNYFALCNGLEFAVYKTTDINRPILFFSVENIEENWDQLAKLLSINSFHVGKTFTYVPNNNLAQLKKEFNYFDRSLLEEIPVKKRASKRHFLAYMGILQSNRGMSWLNILNIFLNQAI
ncbi:MAG: hypothetical protein ACRCR9_06940 [Chitinophagaceae bacterium]